jgi:hypothetical protein
LARPSPLLLYAAEATLLSLALLVLAKPLKARLFPNRKEARRVRLVVERGTPLAELREEIEASEVPLERIVVRPGSVPPRRTTRSWSWAMAAGRRSCSP